MSETMTVDEAREFIRDRVHRALDRGVDLCREEYGVTRNFEGFFQPDGGSVCALGACLLGEMSWKENPADARAEALRSLGITASLEDEFVRGFDDGKRLTPWQRLGDDIATEFLGPRELFSVPVDMDDD